MGTCEFCKRPTKSKENVTFHRFPKNKELAQIWVKNMGRQGWQPKGHSVLCSKHFTLDCFIIKFTMVKLKKNSVPTIFHHTTNKKNEQGQVIDGNVPMSSDSMKTDILKERNNNSVPQTSSIPSSIPYHQSLSWLPMDSHIVQPIQEMQTFDESGSSTLFLSNEYVPEAIECVETYDITGNSSSMVTSEEQYSNIIENLKSHENFNIEMRTKQPDDKQIIVSVKHDHCYSNTVDHLLKRLQTTRKKLSDTKRVNKNLKRKFHRKKITVQCLKQVVCQLKKLKLMPENSNYALSALQNTPLNLFNRMIKNQQSGKITRHKYPAELRCFALTVHFYSPLAYSYVRKTFNMALPHPDTLRTWYSSIDAEPGFTSESFSALKEKVAVAKDQGKNVICALILDEMGIKKGTQRERDGKIRGYVDIGVGMEPGDDLLEARNSLVFMVVPLDSHWKLPIAYFLIDSLTAKVTAGLVKEALIRLENIGIKIASITMDGTAEHFAMANILGAKMNVIETSQTEGSTSNTYPKRRSGTKIKSKNVEFIEPQPHFMHPISTEPPINVIFDPCHMLKLMRNMLDAYKVLVDGNGEHIKWQFIESLALLQEEEGLRLANKLRARHIEYKKMIMKVSLAAQTLSASVADAIEFCDQVLGFPEFKNSSATVRFIRSIDIIFDFLNVRNPWGKGFKSPLRPSNEQAWRIRIIEEISYILKLKLTDGTFLCMSRRKAGLVGFYTAVISVLNIYDVYVKPENSQIKYLLTYKMSQDHLELFFCAIRGRSGWCPNPTAHQFISAYKRLLIHHEVSKCSGNVQQMDSTKILQVTATKEKRAQLDRYDVNIYEELDNLRVEDKYLKIDKPSITDDLEEHLKFKWFTSPNLTEFSTQSVGYIAGYIISKIKRKLFCGDCLSACEATYSADICIQSDNPAAFTVATNRGGLKTPSKSVIKICLITERLFRHACNCNQGRPPKEHNFPAVLAVSVLNELLKPGHDLFPELEQHSMEMFITEDFVHHTHKLIKMIIKSYIEIRMYAATKNCALTITGTNIRHFMNRQIVWAHQ